MVTSERKMGVDTQVRDKTPLREGLTVLQRIEYPVITGGKEGPRVTIQTYVGENNRTGRLLQVGEDILIGDGEDVSDSSDFKHTILLGGGSRMWGVLQQYDKVPYAATTVIAMQGVSDWKDRTVLDLGAGDGVLSIYAAEQGARVIAIDNDKESLYALGENIKGNNVSDKISVYSADLRGPWMQRLEKEGVDLSSVDTVVANIGPVYGEVNKQVLETVSLLPDVRTFIGGGYMYMDIPKDSQDPKSHPWRSLFSRKKTDGVTSEVRTALQRVYDSIDFLNREGFELSQTTIEGGKVRPMSFSAQRATS